MPCWLAAPVAFFIFLGLALPASAQTEPPPSLQMEATAGMAGFVDGLKPIDLSVTVSADVLFAGDLEATLGGVTQALPIEVPAGSSKVYNMRLGTPVGSPQVRLRLLPTDSDTPAATLNLSLKVATDHLIAAVLGPDELAKTIDETVSAITRRDVVGVQIDTDALSSNLDPARYLVLADPIELPPSSRDWLSDGGRLVVDIDSLDSLGLDLPIGAGSFPFGSGWVIGVDGLRQMTEEQWGDVFSPVAYRFAARDSWQSEDGQLVVSAVSGGDQRVPSLPWLFGALVAYAILIGPVNFAILKKLGRRELAWASVPVLALAGVIGFWTAGRERLAEHVANHASVVVASESGVEGRTASVLVVGSEGTRTIGSVDGWKSVPINASTNPNMPFEPGANPLYVRVSPSGGFEFELAALGAAGLSSRWETPLTEVPVLETRVDSGELEVEVSNGSDLSFWTWGVVARGRISVQSEGLEPGASDSLSIRPGNGGFNEFGTVGDAVISQLQLWNDPFAWNRLAPPSQVAANLVSDHDSYFFAYTDELDVPLQVDGSVAQATGTSLVVIPIDLATLMTGEDQSLAATLLDAENASFIDFGPGYVYVQGTSAILGWDVPAATTNPVLQINENFGPAPPVLELYDWEGKSFVSIVANDEVDLSRFRNQRGEVILQVSNDPDNFMETGISPYAFTLEW